MKPRFDSHRRNGAGRRVTVRANKSRSQSRRTPSAFSEKTLMTQTILSLLHLGNRIMSDVAFIFTPGTSKRTAPNPAADQSGGRHKFMPCHSERAAASRNRPRRILPFRKLSESLTSAHCMNDVRSKFKTDDYFFRTLKIT